MRRYTLHKDSRLKSQKSISEAFVRGLSTQVFPVRVYYYLLPEADHPSVKAAFIAPKKNFKRAVDRNRIKRQMREAYRLNQYLLKDEVSDSVELKLVFLYYNREKLNYTIIEKAMQKILKRLAKEISREQ